MVDESVFLIIVRWFEVLGVVVMIVGFVLAAVLTLRALVQGRGGKAAYVLLRTLIGSSLLLGLEVLVAADLIRTISSTPSLEETAVLGLIVLIRTVLSISLQVEIEGVVPWKRALLTSGGQVLARAVADEVRPSPESAPRE